MADVGNNSGQENSSNASAEEHNISVLIDDGVSSPSDEDYEEPAGASHAMVIAVVLVLASIVYIGFQKRSISDDLPMAGSGPSAVPSVAAEKFEVSADKVTKEKLLNQINPSDATIAVIVVKPAKIIETANFKALSPEAQKKFKHLAELVVGCDIPIDDIEEVMLFNGLSSSYTLLTTKKPIDKDEWLKSKNVSIKYGDVTVYADADDQVRIPMSYVLVQPNLIWAANNEREIRNMLKVIDEDRKSAPLENSDSLISMRIGDMTKFRAMRAAAGGAGSPPSTMSQFNRETERLRREVRSQYVSWTRDVKFIQFDVKGSDKWVVSLKSESDTADNAKNAVSTIDGVRSALLSYLALKSKEDPKATAAIKAAQAKKVEAKGTKLEYSFPIETPLLEAFNNLIPRPPKPGSEKPAGSDKAPDAPAKKDEGKKEDGAKKDSGAKKEDGAKKDAGKKTSDGTKVPGGSGKKGGRPVKNS